MDMITFGNLQDKTDAIAVVGLGYVGLPLAVALGRHFKVIGVDVSQKRVDELNERYDRTGEVDFATVGEDVDLTFSADLADLEKTRLILVAVPHPHRRIPVRPICGPSPVPAVPLASISSPAVSWCTNPLCTPV